MNEPPLYPSPLQNFSFPSNKQANEYTNTRITSGARVLPLNSIHLFIVQKEPTCINVRGAGLLSG